MKVILAILQFCCEGLVNLTTLYWKPLKPIQQTLTICSFDKRNRGPEPTQWQLCHSNPSSRRGFSKDILRWILQIPSSCLDQSIIPNSPNCANPWVLHVSTHTLFSSQSCLCSHSKETGKGSCQTQGMPKGFCGSFCLPWIHEDVRYEQSHTRSYRGERGGKPPTEPETSGITTATWRHNWGGHSLPFIKSGHQEQPWIEVECSRARQ